MKRLQAICLSLLIAVAAMADINVKGTVIGAEDGEPMPGVSILVKGTSTGTITGIDGDFSLTVPDNAVLQFSFMGFKTVEQAAQPSMRISLETETTELQEVVSLGYSAVKKAELSSAVVTVSAEALTDVTSSDIGNMLQGKVAGLQVSNSTGQPGAAAEIRIRGTGSITAASDPVYVVDGVMGGSFNPNDVESISILKDAGSTGIYGAAAAGGVIVVTTKQGSKDQKPRINVRATVGATQPLFGNYVMMGSEELYNFHKYMYNNNNVKGENFNALRPITLLDEDYRWRDYFFKTGITQDYYISVAGGTKKLGYYASFDYYKQDGTFKQTGYEKFSGRANINAEIAKWLDIRLSTYFDKSNSTSESSWEMMDDAYNKMPWDNPYDADGNLVKIAAATRPDNGKAWYSQNRWNSLYNAQFDYAKGTGLSMGVDMQLNFHITDWLTLQSSNRYSHSNSKWISYSDPRSNATGYNGYLENTIDFSNSFGTTNILKAAYQWGNHSVNGMVGFEYGLWKSEYTNVSGTGMPNGVDALNATVPQGLGGYEIPGASWATFIQASYDYAKRYFITATFRAEASSIFAPQNRVGYFPSVAASWLISNEEFMKSQDIVSFLKLRASYGVTGNNNIPAYKYLATYALSTSYQNVTAAIPSRLSNPLLHWETANMATVGVDLTFINRIDMSLDLYNTDNTGLLLDVPVAPSTGFFEITKNAGTVRNQGIEYRIDATAIKTKDWRWDIGFNIGFNRNRVTYTPDHIPFLQSASSVNQQVKEGQDIYSWYMKEWAGVDPENGDPLWYVVDSIGDYVLDANGNKTTTNNYKATNARVVGKATPIFQGGLNTQVSWKGLTLSINTNFTYGNKVYNYNRQTNDADGAYLGHNQLSIENSKLGWSRWESPGDQATHPKGVLNGNKSSNEVSSRYLEDGSFFRLKNITLSYDFAAVLIPKKYMSKCRVYISADNLFTATKFSGLDPEVSITTTTYKLAGMYSDHYPVPRNIVGGIEIEF
ncbi:MAG: SusC/RagA family TonB-linked outer membrane protein [Paludibacteraceae bacterium]|nr:SusC/RagA family TonB-linked outer membrane protein [Paludibacteraceae bacterium]